MTQQNEEFATEEEIKEARELYQTDDVEIDDGAKASRANGEGLWVAAWVWLERRS